jgi:hypothetical protein
MKGFRNITLPDLCRSNLDENSYASCQTESREPSVLDNTLTLT